jgi:hypothetical protein
MGFSPGRWQQGPSNCTSSYDLSFSRCADYGTQALTKCVSWAFNAAVTCLQWAWQTTQQCLSWGQQTSQSCVDWANQTSQQCCDWWPCSWFCDIVMVIVTVVCLAWEVVVTAVCLLWGAVVSLVCVAFAIVVSVVCLVFVVIEWIVCLVWSFIQVIFCLSEAKAGTMFLLTDGTVMVQECMSIFGATWATHRWWRLTPDARGDYANGTWSARASSIVARRYFGSAVLADGRVIVCGGEYSDASGTQNQDWTNSCEIYDPVADSWSLLPTPTDSGGAVWSEVGDPACTLLPDGTLLIGAPNDANIAKFDPVTMSWTAMSGYPIRTSDEDSWVLMPDGTVVAPSCNAPPQTCMYTISTDQWTLGNALPTSIISAAGSEVGPGLLRYDGSAFFIGGNQNTATYSAAANPRWANGPSLPAQNGQNIGVMDGPAVLLVNGNILVGAAPVDNQGSYLSPCFYFEFDGTTFNRTSDPPSANCPTYVTRLLLLPNGDTLYCREDDSAFWIYRPNAAVPDARTRPVIQSVPNPIGPGSTIQVSGLQFNGLSQAVAYGDDAQAATNYPLLRITNSGSGNVRYCRTFNHATVDDAGNTVTSMGVATGGQVITTSVAIPADLEQGDSRVEVVANGIPSESVAVKVTPEGDRGRRR